MNHTYHTVEHAGTAEFKDRGSRFLGFVFPVNTPEACKKNLKEIKKQHPKANHHCFAYRLGTDGLQFRSSDAGEPSGTAGKPILGQIDRLQATDVLVIVVRYFGGTLLGIPGLIHAYKTTAALALQMAPLITKKIEKKFRLSFDYTLMNPIMQILRQYDCTILTQEMQLFCMMEIGVPVQHLDLCLAAFNDIPQLELIPL